MKTKIIILTEPKSWNFTDQNTGEFKHGNSAMVFMPSEGALQSFSNLPTQVESNCAYDADIGFKIGTDKNGKPTTSLKLVSVDLGTKKIVNWGVLFK